HAPLHLHQHLGILPPANTPPPRHHDARAPWPSSPQAVTVSSRPSLAPARKEQPRTELWRTKVPPKTAASCMVPLKSGITPRRLPERLIAPLPHLRCSLL